MYLCELLLRGRYVVSEMVTLCLLVLICSPSLGASRLQDSGDFNVVKGAVTRSIALCSGKFTYQWRHFTPAWNQRAENVVVTDWTYSFSGISRSKRTSTQETVSHEGKTIEFTKHLQRQGWYDYTASVAFAKSANENKPEGPVFAGSFWYGASRSYVDEHARSVRKLRDEMIDGIPCQVLEWDVPVPEVCNAFYLVRESIRLRQPARLRIWVAPQLGFVLPRVEHITLVNNKEELDSLFLAKEFFDAGGGVFLPREFQEQAFRIGGVLGYSDTFRLRSVEYLNQDVPQEEFRVRLPLGTYVTDRRTKEGRVGFRVGPETQLPADLESIVIPEVARPKSNKIGWAIGSGVGVGGILVGWGYYRRQGRRRNVVP